MASTFGRMFGPLTPRLPRRLPFLRLPLAPRKSVAGFMAASVTGACAAVMFWGWIAPLRHNGADLSWTWQDGVRGTSSLLSWLGGARGWLGLGTIGIVAGLVSGIAEALGNFSSRIFDFGLTHSGRPRFSGRQLDSPNYIWRMHPCILQVDCCPLMIWMRYVISRITLTVDTQCNLRAKKCRHGYPRNHVCHVALQTPPSGVQVRRNQIFLVFYRRLQPEID